MKNQISKNSHVPLNNLSGVKTAKSSLARGHIPLATGYVRYNGTPENARWGTRRAAERRGRRRSATLGNTWKHMYPRFVPGYTKCSPACRTSPASGTFCTAMRGNILCTRVQNAGTRVPGKRNVGNNMGTNHGVGVHVFLWGRGCMTSFIPHGTAPKTFRCLPRFRSVSDPLFLYRPVCSVPWLHIGLLCFLGLRVMGQVIVQRSL